MGELQTEHFQFTFNGFLKVAFHGSRITSDAGLILVRELDERLGLEALIAAHLSDSRQGANTQFSVADLLRQSVYSRLAGLRRPQRRSARVGGPDVSSQGGYPVDCGDPYRLWLWPRAPAATSRQYTGSTSTAC